MTNTQRKKGPESELAGKNEACEGCPNQAICASAPKGPDPGNSQHDQDSLRKAIN